MADLFFLSLDDAADAMAAVDTRTFVRELRSLDDTTRQEVAEYVLSRRRPLHVGDVVHVTMPYSECAMHMQIAGELHAVRVCDSGVRLLNADGRDGPHMTDGEAGIMQRGDVRYVA